MSHQSHIDMIHTAFMLLCKHEICLFDNLFILLNKIPFVTRVTEQEKSNNNIHFTKQ